MGTKCCGCDSSIFDLLFMECAKVTCKKIYHLKCLAITNEQHEKLSVEYKNNWICPECTRNVPKMGNSETPIRQSVMNKTFTPGNFVNTERGSHGKLDGSYVGDREKQILEELREFRLEVTTRFDEQREAFKIIQEKLRSSESEVQELKKITKVLQEKAGRVDELEKAIKSISETNKESDKKEKPLHNKGAENSYSKAVQVKLRTEVATDGGVATKHTISNDESMAKQTSTTETGILVTTVTEGETQNNEKEEEWTVVSKKKHNRYPDAEVKRGGNKSTLAIQGLERKKHLHVWRLRKNTTVESMEAHVRSICGDVEIKVDLIKHKKERNYRSFIIGVPESKYEALCDINIWPTDVEYCEWIWFRRAPSTSRQPATAE